MSSIPQPNSAGQISASLKQSVAISVRNASKSYRIWRNPSARIIGPILDTLAPIQTRLTLAMGLSDKNKVKEKSIHKDFHALHDVTFDIIKGESVGIIGRNGSGKSTLLQMIAGTLTPTSGQIDVHGRVAALLELGSGFNPDFTGRENVYLSASILGLSRKEIDARYDEITEFADIGDFINQPVKTYSSGMMVRLAFSVQALIEPPVLIIDEALSVGDYFFTQKCFSLIRKLKENGTTLLFVSHDMGTVRDICTRAIYLKEGRIQFDGEVTKAINHYFNNASTPAAGLEKLEQNKMGAHNIILKHSGDSPKAARNTAEPSAKIISIKLLNASNNELSSIKIGEKIIFRIIFKAITNGNYRVCVAVKNRQNQIITSNSCLTAGLPARFLHEGEQSTFELEMTAMFEAGVYTYKVYLAKDHSLHNRNEVIEETDWMTPFTLTWDYENETAPFLGMFGPPVTAFYK